ncbi:MAG: phage minor head protein [Halobacteria archaeon]
MTKTLNPLLFDRTLTGRIRKLFDKELSSRFDALKKSIVELIVDEDVFGLNLPKLNIMTSGVLARNTIWRFLTDDQKLEEFKRWVRSQVDITVLGSDVFVGGALSEDHYVYEYISRAFSEGIERAFISMRTVDYAEKLDFIDMTKEQFLRSVFARPVSFERVKLLASRVFADLKNVTEDMATKMQRVLTDGFIRGESPWTIARSMIKEIDISKQRAKRIARTEIIRAHNEGQLDGLESLGVEDVGVAVEWVVSGLCTTARGYPSPCPLCKPLAGMVLTIREARGMLPRHPNCMCSWVPANVGEDHRGQLRTRGRIMSAISKSIKAEMSRKNKRLSLKEQKKLSRWIGAEVRVSKKRPKGI